MVLYRKYRPQTFNDIVGQEQIKETLLGSLTSGKISHAYLFSGPRGTGKTSMARILAKSVNCLRSKNKFGDPCNNCDSCLAITNGRHLDLIEIDAASNRGIDEIRELREKIKLAPSSGKFKVYIIDEAHMLTHDAFNALLKTLEEPPPHAIFILATTEPQKLPATIISRTSRFDFRMPSVPDILEKLKIITKAEGWKIGDEALNEIAKAATGAYRDGEVLLEKVSSTDTKANLEKTRQILGKTDSGSIINLISLIDEGQTKHALSWLNNYTDNGGSVRVLAEGVLDTLRKILLVKAEAENILNITVEELGSIKEISDRLSKERSLQLINLFNSAIEDLRESTIPQLPLELAIIEASLDKDDSQKTQIKEERHLKEERVVDPKKETKDNIEKLDDNGKENENPITSKEEQKLFAKVVKNWPKIVKEAKVSNNSLAYFLKDARPSHLDEDLLTIEFGFPFHKQKSEEIKYREIIEAALEKIVGMHLRFKGVVNEKARPVKKEEPKPQKKEVDPMEVFGKLE